MTTSVFVLVIAKCSAMCRCRSFITKVGIICSNRVSFDNANQTMIEMSLRRVGQFTGGISWECDTWLSFSGTHFLIVVLLFATAIYVIFRQPVNLVSILVAVVVPLFRWFAAWYAAYDRDKRKNRKTTLD